MEDHKEYNIFQFLEEHRIKDKTTKTIITHTSMDTPKGSFSISEDKNDILYNLYFKEIQKGTKMCLIERHKSVSPLLIDLDFKFDIEKVNSRQYTVEHIKQIVNLYNEEIKNVFNITDEDRQLKSFIFEKPEPYTSKGILKDGIHIMYPFIVSEPNVQYYIRDNILKKIGPFIEDINFENKIHDIVDKSIIYKNGWFLYGSTKPGCSTYELSYILNKDLDIITIDEYSFEGIENPIEFFSIRNKKNSVVIKSDKRDLISKQINTANSIQKKRLESKNKKKFNISIDETFKSIVLNISEDKADDFHTWINIGLALHNIDPTNKDLLDIWKEFSQKSDKYEEGICEKHWDQMSTRNDGVSIGSLYYWSRESDPERYNEIRRSSIQYWIDKTINSVNNWDIAKVLYEMYKFNYVYAGKNSWFEFREHRYHQINDAMTLRQKISTELCNEYQRLISDNNKIITSDDPNISEDDRESLEKKNKVLTDICGKLKTTKFKDDVIKECRELFLQEKFEEKLDNNLYLVGFENGVYDLSKGEFRDGTPDDYISLSTNIEYIPFQYISSDDPDFLELQHFLETVFVEEDIRNYVLKFLASCLQGHNAEEKFRIWTGCGSNGKSKLEELFLNSFGDYCINFPITLLLGKRAASNSATPEIAQAKGKRFGYFEEPNENERINVGLMKEYTGGSKLKARALHKEPIEFKPQFKLVLLCNDIPQVPPDDQGTWRRMEITEFKSRFCDTPDPSNPFEFPIDIQLSNKLKNWKEYFMSYLIEIYKDYKINGIKPPHDVIKYTEEHKKQCDLYIEFIQQYIKKSSKYDEVNITFLYEEFNGWHTENFGSNKKTPSKKEFNKYLQKKIGKKYVVGDIIKNHKFVITTSKSKDVIYREEEEDEVDPKINQLI